MVASGNFVQCIEDEPLDRKDAGPERTENPLALIARL
jgi:hypothetical protein